MRVGKLLDNYEVRVTGEGPTALVADLWHFVRNAAGGSDSRRVGHLALSPRPAQPESAAHWQADVSIDTAFAAELRARHLPEAVTDWLLRETPAREPLLVQIHEGTNTDFVLRGEIWDDD